MSRIGRAFSNAKAERRTALVCYLMAGVPSMPRSMEMVMACVRGGADVMEIGVPFSDPVADGPVIQEASVKALENGVTPRMVLDLVRELRSRTDVPIVLMGYYNPIFRFGEERYVKECISTGVDGLIVPDLPLHESGSLMKLCRESGLDLVQLSTPLTPDQRAAELANATSGFLYLVTRPGITGGDTGTTPDMERQVRRAHEANNGMPVAAGFGISTPEKVRALRGMGADGVIVGSALVALTLDGSSSADLEKTVATLAEACKGRTGEG
ncbi:MAG: tryptophan synthase subunit alpha [Methanomassiliicoccales archaeon]|nr:tryptophan synthase subunit alpha [Methanomassiliicoccales archaeon]